MQATLYSSRFRKFTPLVFLDSHASINLEKTHLYFIEDCEWIDGAKELFLNFKAADFATNIVSNEHEIVPFIYTDDKVNFLHEHEVQQFDHDQSVIAAVYFFLSYPVYGLQTSGDCLTSAFSMLFQRDAGLNLGYKISWIIGFNLSNFEPGNIVGFRSVLLSTGHQKFHDDTAAPFPSAISNHIEATLNIVLETSRKLHTVNSIGQHNQSIALQLYSLGSAPLPMPMASRRLN